MADRELKKLRRAELLEMMLELSDENDRLKEENRQLRRQMEDRKILISESGSIAEAAMQLSGVFAAAQDAADRYLESVRSQSERMQQGNNAASSDGDDGNHE